MDRTNVLRVTDHPDLLAVVRTDDGFIGFFKAEQNPACVDLRTAHALKELPEATYRNVTDVTLTTAAADFAKRKKRR